MTLYTVLSWVSNRNFFLLSVFVLIFLGLVLFFFLRSKKKEEGKLRSIIVGHGEVAERFIAMALSSRTMFDLIGRVEDDAVAKKYNISCLGQVSDIVPIVQNHQIDAVIVAQSTDDQQATLDTVVSSLRGLPIQVIILPNYYEFALYRPKVKEFEGISFIYLHQSALNRTDRFLKRCLDVTLSCITLTLLSPVMAIIAIAIKSSLDGPILFKQDRIGEQGKIFKIFKFRSMVINADDLISQVKEESEDGTFIYKKKDDPRITRVGKFIRRTSLDELPQLFNVLRGEMSLVGPRPELPWLVEEYKPWQRIRFAVPQGITGWWQINGRSDKPMHLNTSEDLYYVQNYSIWLDLYILLKTPLVVLRGKGAY